MYIMFCATVAAVAGCGRQLPTLAPVSGRVSLGDDPVVQGRITFVPSDGRRPATAAIGADGRYMLGTFTAGDGAVLGEHRVVIDVRSAGASQPTLLEEELRGGSVAGEFTWIVPEEYAAVSTTPLTAHVRSGRNVFDFRVPKQTPHSRDVMAPRRGSRDLEKPGVPTGHAGARRRLMFF
jgi:hypothetical protein